MKTVAELQAIRKQITERSKTLGIAVLTPEQAADLVDQSIEDRQIINRWYGFLKLMAERSQWGPQINDLLDEYLFGTANKEVQAAARKFLERSKLHDRGSKL